VVEVFQDFQALLDDLVAFLALDVSDEADAAGVMLVLRVVQTLRGGNRMSRLKVVVDGDTVCEGPDRPFNRFSIAAVRTAAATARSLRWMLRVSKTPEFGIYATNQWNSK
jgi:hypothetical protein